MRRAGSTRRPFFRVVVTEHSSPRDGRFVEIIGHYNPRTAPETLVLDRGRLAHWVGVGATMSDTVRTLVGRMPPPAEAAAPASEASGPRERSGDPGAPGSERVGGSAGAEPPAL
jgi:small subunit ribosomal protein S16